MMLEIWGRFDLAKSYIKKKSRWYAATLFKVIVAGCGCLRGAYFPMQKRENIDASRSGGVMAGVISAKW